MTENVIPTPIPNKCPKCSLYHEGTGKGTWVYMKIDGEMRPVCEDCGYIDQRAGIITLKKRIYAYAVRDPWGTSLPVYASQWRLLFYRWAGW